MSDRQAGLFLFTMFTLFLKNKCNRGFIDYNYQKNSTFKLLKRIVNQRIDRDFKIRSVYRSTILEFNIRCLNLKGYEFSKRR